jgi:hypothetical protein
VSLGDGAFAGYLDHIRCHECAPDLIGVSTCDMKVGPLSGLDLH